MQGGGILLAFLPIIYLSEIIHHWLVLSGDGGKGGELRGYAVNKEREENFDEE